MKGISTAAIVIVVAVAASGLGYWWGAAKSAPRSASTQQAGAKAERKILHYRNPMVPTDTSPVPKKAPDGMDYAPVYADDAGDKSSGKILYYRNPMGLPDTSPAPKKDPMGMDYIAVYEGEEPASGPPVVKLSVDKVQKLGVRTEAVTPRQLVRTVRAVATIQADERRLHTVAPRFDGWIQKLYVNTTGQSVRTGEVLMDVYSPDLISAQQEYLIASKGVQTVQGGSPEVQASMQQLVDSALQRLRNWDIAESELRRLQQEGKARQYVTLRSPVNGVVLDKPSIQGKRFMAGEVLYQIADLTNVWMVADVFEQDIGMVHAGQSAKIRVDAYPDKAFDGKVTFIYPTVTPETRTAKVRIELANAQGLLKPAMYATAEFASSHSKDKALTVPDSAVLDSGTRQLVLVQRGEGRFEPRPVKLGMRADGYFEVLDGVKAGEVVVVSANFLIDAESNLKAAIGSFGHSAHAAKPGGKEQARPAAPSAAPATHHGEGTIDAVDAKAGTATLAHGPIASLKWPAMTMHFRAKDPALLQTLKTGQKIAFELVEETPGEFVIVRVQAAGAAAGAHKGH